MSNSAPMPQWQPPAAYLRAPAALPVSTTSEINWRSETVVALLVVAYSTVLGGVVGLLWSRFAPKIYDPKQRPRLADAINGSEAAAKVVLGDDMWLALFAILGGVVAVAVLAVAARDAGSGPGGMIGLAVGGLLGTLVAMHLGHQIQTPHLAASLRHSFPGVTARDVSAYLGYFGFRLRIKSFVVVWPVVAVLLQVVVVGIRALRSDGSTQLAAR